MENDFTKYKTLYYLIEKAVQAAREGDALRARDYMSSIVNWAEERSLMERSRALLEVLKIVKSEYENPSELPYTHMVNQIKDKMTENHAKILELIKSQYNGLFKDVKEIEDED